jgi:hypothetical protein
MHATNHLLIVEQTPKWSPGLTFQGLGIVSGEVSGEVGDTEPDDESWLKLLGNEYLCRAESGGP